MKVYILILSIISTLIFESCCKRKTLTCPYSGLRITSVGYSYPEIDSIMIFRFENNGNFNNLIDSTLVKIDSSDLNPSLDTLNLNYFGFADNNNSDRIVDFKIKIMSDNKIISLSKFNIDIKTYSIHCTTMERNVKCVSPILNYLQDGFKIENNDDKLFILK